LSRLLAVGVLAVSSVAAQAAIISYTADLGPELAGATGTVL
jgi:hypothetical protein